MEGVQLHELQKILQLRGSLQQTDDECGSMFFIGLACAMSEHFCKDAREVIMLVAQIGSNNDQILQVAKHLRGSFYVGKLMNLVDDHVSLSS